jgi:hypothetical protein
MAGVRKIAFEVVLGCSASKAILHILRTFGVSSNASGIACEQSYLDFGRDESAGSEPSGSSGLSGASDVPRAPD